MPPISLLSASSLAAAGILLLTFLVARSIMRSRRVAHIPGVRYGRIPGFRSWVGAYAFLRDPEGVLREGFEKYPTGTFRVATLTGENLVCNGAAKLSEYISAPDDVLNVQDAINMGIQFRWTMGNSVYTNPVSMRKVPKTKEDSCIR